MSSTATPDLGPGRESLPPKKRDPRPSISEQLPLGTFKVPYPHRSQNVVKPYNALPSGLLRPAPTSVPQLYQPWTQSCSTASTTRANPYLPSPVRDSHGWAEWREFCYRGWAAVPSGLDVPYILHDPSTQPHDAPRHPSVYTHSAQPVGRPGGEDGGYRWNLNHMVGEKSSPHTAQQSNGRQRGPHLRRGKPGGHQARPSTGRGPAPPHTGLSPTAYRDGPYPPDLVYTNHSKAHRYPALGQCFLESAARSPKRPSPSDQLTEKYRTVMEKVEVSPPRSSRPATSPDQLPWLLPHFAAGSLVELRDGQLRKVEDLRAEDFLIGAEACPELRLSSCTVQSISPSTTPSLSRLHMLLQEERSQECLDVYVEYPFFVQGRGWSSCCPQRTARLCGLRCHQLSVGDVCLALIPMSPSTPLPSQPEGKCTPAGGEDGRPKPLLTSSPQTALPPVPDRPTEGQRMGHTSARKRRWSAPELRGPGTNCPY
ncbi:ataxin-1 [Esox lucius]|uniref:AXH domain-containing protein n=1 Tax=Esox lucius TaxID=8010 RepID=A0A3P8XJH8_ESOLU|nr:ataxin-1 [Esox lucius]